MGKSLYRVQVCFDFGWILKVDSHEYVELLTLDMHANFYVRNSLNFASRIALIVAIKSESTSTFNWHTLLLSMAFSYI